MSRNKNKIAGCMCEEQRGIRIDISASLGVGTGMKR